MRRDEFDRVYGGKERLEWVRSQPCCVCARNDGCENHHVRSGGTGRKADARWIVPLCAWCHRRYHNIGKLSLLQWANRENDGLRVYHRTPPDLLEQSGRTRPHVAVVRYYTWEDAAAAIDRAWRHYAERMGVPTPDPKG